VNEYNNDDDESSSSSNDNNDEKQSIMMDNIKINLKSIMAKFKKVPFKWG